MKTSSMVANIVAIFLLATTGLILAVPADSSAVPKTSFGLLDLQGSWEGDGPSGNVSITITGDSLHFFARIDFWYETTFTLLPGADPRQLQATINNSAQPDDDIGQTVVAIYKIENGTLTLAVGDGSGLPPFTFAGASSRYELKKTQPPGRN